MLWLTKEVGSMNVTRSVVPMRAAKTGYIVLSALFCLLGGALLVCPKVSVLLFGRFLGVSMILFGVVKLVGYFSKDLFRLAFQYDLAFGILLIALGAIVLVRPENSMSFFAIILGVCVLTDGLFKIQIAIDSRAFGIRLWWLIFLLAAVPVALGILLVLRPGDGARLVVTLLGLSLLSEGILNLCVAVCTVKIVAYQRPDSIDFDISQKGLN